MQDRASTPKRPKRPRDINQIAYQIVQEATSETGDSEVVLDSGFGEVVKNPAAVALGKLGGAKGGRARAAKLSPEERKEIASQAAKARWGNREKP